MHINFTILSTGVIFILLSAVGFSENAIKRVYSWLTFSKIAPIFTLGSGGICFLKNVLSLSVADFGNHKIPLSVFFGIIILLSFFAMRELLAIRGLAVLLLVCASSMLENVYCEPILWKNWFVSAVYAIIIFAMIIGAVPYLLRDFLEFLSKTKRARVCSGIFFLAYGILLSFISFNVLPKF